MMKKVLCVDDDSISLTISKLLLKRTGFAAEVVYSIDGSEALDYFDQLFFENAEPAIDAPNLIFLDINMPVMNGWEFLDEYVVRFADKLQNTKVVILSSTIDPEDFARAKKYDVVSQFVSKPLSIENIAELRENEFVKTFFK